MTYAIFAIIFILQWIFFMFSYSFITKMFGLFFLVVWLYFWYKAYYTALWVSLGIKLDKKVYSFWDTINYEIKLYFPKGVDKDRILCLEIIKYLYYKPKQILTDSNSRAYHKKEVINRKYIDEIFQTSQPISKEFVWNIKILEENIDDKVCKVKGLDNVLINSFSDITREFNESFINKWREKAEDYYVLRVSLLWKKKEIIFNWIIKEKEILMDK